MVATERLYLTADRQTAVKAGDKKAVYLLAAKGQEIPDVIVRLYGLDKKRAKKPANKMVGKVADKGFKTKEKER